MLFPVKNSHLVDPKQILVVLKSEKQEKKKKRGGVPSLFCNFFPCYLQFSTFPFFDFPSSLFHFPFFPCLSFPGRSAEISWWEVSAEALCSPCPPAVMLIMLLNIVKNFTFTRAYTKRGSPTHPPPMKLGLWPCHGCLSPCYSAHY